MTPRLCFEPLSVGHVPELGPVLLNEAVYEHIGGNPPSFEDFELGIRRVLAGPKVSCDGQVWINYIVRHSHTGTMLGRLEATVHDGIGEVAFLFGKEHWRQGFATEGLLWLNELLLARSDCRELWATTVPANHRSQALLGRCGYWPSTQMPSTSLLSYDDGDLVFRGPSAA